MKKPPLLLLHGICNNANLFTVPDYGLGRYLAEHFDIFPVSYPIEAHRSQNWDFDFHLHNDMPVIWKNICREVGGKPFVFGYSMGGMLAVTAQAHGIIDAPAIVTAGSPFSFEMVPLYPPLMRTWVRFSRLIGYHTVPIKVLGRMLCSIFTAVSPSKKMLDLNLFRYLIKNATVNVPVETFFQSLTWSKTRNFTDRTGKINYLSRLPDVKVPTCMIYGSDDRVAPERAVEKGYLALGARKKALFRIENGTHMNMTAGPKAKLVSEIARAWCCENDGLD